MIKDKRLAENTALLLLTENLLRLESQVTATRPRASQDSASRPFSLKFPVSHPQGKQRITSSKRDPDIKPRSHLRPNIDSNKYILCISNSSQAERTGREEAKSLPRAQEPTRSHTASLEGKDHPCSARGLMHLQSPKSAPVSTKIIS